MADEEKKLLMDLESRLARAKEMGFDVDNPVYHGSPDPNIKKLKRDSFLSSNPSFANLYSRAHQDIDGASVYPLFLKKENIFNPNNSEHLEKLKPFLFNRLTENPEIGLAEHRIHQELMENPKNIIRDYERRADNIIKGIRGEIKSIDPESNWSLMENSLIRNAIEDAGFSGSHITEAGNKNIHIYDPSIVRSKFAAFDPAKSESADLLAFSGGKKPKFPSIGKALCVAGTISDVADIAKGDIAEGALGLGSLVAGRASPYLGALRPEKTVSEEMESRQLQEAKEKQESEEETKYKREALRRLMSSQED